MARNNHKGIDIKAFRELDRRYRLNGHFDPLCRAFNTLPADDRAIMLAYIVVGKKKRHLANLLGVSYPVINDRLWRIQVVVKERYEKILRDMED